MWSANVGRGVVSDEVMHNALTCSSDDQGGIDLQSICSKSRVLKELLQKKIDRH